MKSDNVITTCLTLMTSNTNETRVSGLMSINKLGFICRSETFDTTWRAFLAHGRVLLNV